MGLAGLASGSSLSVVLSKRLLIASRSARSSKSSRATTCKTARPMPDQQKSRRVDPGPFAHCWSATKTVRGSRGLPNQVRTGTFSYLIPMIPNDTNDQYINHSRRQLCCRSLAKLDLPRAAAKAMQ